MREILFRGKRKDNGEWVCGDYVVMMDGNKAHHHIYGKGEVVPETVGQYTGIKDRNGRKIFEDDILCSYYDNIYTESMTLEVVMWYNNAWHTKWRSCTPDIIDQRDTLSHSEVIGNIHDNPELLEGQE